MPSVSIKRLLESLLSLRWFERVSNVVAAMLVIITILLISGAVSISAGRSIPLFGLRVFFPAPNIQTYAEFVVVSAYYALGTAGIILYFMVTRGAFSERNARYALVGSTFLIIIALAGLIAGQLAKR